MKITGRFFSRARKIKNNKAIVPAFFAIAGLMAIVAVGRVITYAATQTGNFNQYVQTTIKSLDKNADNSEKTSYLTGETITMTSQVNITGDSERFDNPYMLIKIPNQYLDGNPTVSTTQASTGTNMTTDGDYKVARVNYNLLASGTFLSVNYVFKLKNEDTPAGYQPEIIHELYNGDGTLLSRQAKVLTMEKGVYEVTTKRVNVNGVVSDSSVYIAPYNGAKDGWDRGILSRRGVSAAVDNSNWIQNRNNNDNPSKYGKKKVSEATIVLTLPEYFKLSDKATADGWSFDETTRTATLKTSMNSSGEYYYSTKSVELNVEDTIPDSMLNQTVNINQNFTANFSDGTSLSSSSLATARLLGYDLAPNSDLGFTKSFGYARQMGDLRSADGVIEYNYNSITSSSYAYWELKLNIKDDGTDDPVKFDYISDTPSGVSRYIRLVSVGSNKNIPDKYKDNIKFDFYEVNEDGSETLIKSGTKYETSIPIGREVKSLRIKLSDGASLPRSIGMPDYDIKFIIFTNVDAGKAKTGIESSLNGKTDVENAATITINGIESAEQKAKYRIYREKSLISNGIGSYNSLINMRNGDKLPMYIHPSRIGSDRAEIGSELPNGKAILVFPKGLTPIGKLKTLLDAGKATYIDNYGGDTTKDALVVDLGNETDNITDQNFQISDLLANGTYNIDLITVWDANSQYFESNQGKTTIDIYSNGNPIMANVTRSSTNFSVLKPEQISSFKSVRRNNGVWSDRATNLRPGETFNYRTAMINISQKPIQNVKTLDVLPYAGDKTIVEDNSGVQSNRGSTVAATLTGPVADVADFTITYSLDAPGATQAESMAKNFVTKDQITDWSAVRMIKMEQNAGTTIQPNTVVPFYFDAKIPEGAANGSIAVNSVAVQIDGVSRLVEANSVSAQVAHDAHIKGIAFEDMNGNSIFDTGDVKLAGYKAKLIDSSNKVIAEQTTGADGSYDFTTRDFGATRTVQFEKPASDTDKVLVARQVNDSTAGNVSSNISDVDNLKSYSVSVSSGGTYIRNIGIKTPRGTVKVAYVDANGNTIKDSVTIKDNVPTSETYDSTSSKETEITKDGLVYAFSKLKDGSAAETGSVAEGTTTVTYQYTPKAGGEVSAKFVVSGTNTEIAPSAVVTAAGTQVGTPYAATRQDELTKDGLVYTFAQVKTSGAAQTGKVTASAQTVIFEYTAKAGKAVTAEFVDENGRALQTAKTVKAEGTQVGTVYSDTPANELTSGGITYALKEWKTSSAPQNGRVSTAAQTITYVYTPKKGGQVVANYVDQNGRAIKATKVVKATDTPVGTAYSDTPDQQITADTGLVYTFSKLATGSAAQNGTVAVNTQTITYQYAPKAGGQVVAKFVDEKGNELASSQTIQAKGTQVGTPYAATHQDELTKDGLVYTFSKLSDSSAAQTGKVKEGEQAVIFTYQPKKGGQVVAKFVDQNGNELKDESEVSPAETQVGTPYTATHDDELTKDGLVYVFEKLGDKSAAQTGKVKEGEQTVIFTYQPKKGGEVVAKFVDVNGVQLKSDEILAKAGTQVGTPYKSESAQTFELSGRKYRLKEVKGEQTGKVIEGEIEVVYIFEDITPKAPDTGFLRQNPAAILAAAVAILTGLSWAYARKRI